MKPPSMESFESRRRALFCFIQKHVIPEGLIGNLVFLKQRIQTISPIEALGDDELSRGGSRRSM